MKLFDIDRRPKYVEIDGVKYPPAFIPDIFHQGANYRPRKDDVIVATYPKCGCTLASQMVVLNLRKGEPPETTEEYFSCMPFMEASTPEQLKAMARPGCIKTHLPFDKINYSPDAKYIYIARHPADCVVSRYHHTRYFPVYQFTDGSFDTYFDLFINGDVDYGDYFDHLMSWYKQRKLPNVLFLTYEGMKKHHWDNVMYVARFLDYDFYRELFANENFLLDNVLFYTYIDYMKMTVNKFWREAYTVDPPVELQEQNDVMKRYAELLKEATSKGFDSTGDFIRKAEVGEGKATLSPEQMGRLNKRILEKTIHSDVMDLWKDFF